MKEINDMFQTKPASNAPTDPCRKPLINGGWYSIPQTETGYELTGEESHYKQEDPSQEL